MNPTKALLLLFMCLVSVYCLQLTSHKQNLKDSFFTPSHKKMSYFGRHYLSYRTHEYIQQVKQDNLEYIESFNAKNKEALKDLGGEKAKGGQSFILGPNKFITFTEEEFTHLFTGLRTDQSNSSKSHMAKKPSHKLSFKDQKKHSVSQDIFDHMLISKVDPNFSHEAEQMEIHQKEALSHVEEGTSDHDQNDDDWVFDNPFELNDTEIDQLYGKANSDDSWGWDWKSFDPDYYNTEEDTDELSDFDTYWKKWEDDHWGYDDEDSVKDGSESPWFKKWYEEAEKNSNNPEWWGSQDSTKKLRSEKKQEHEQQVITGWNPYPEDAQQVNWAYVGGTTHVKDQGICGSCWAFSTIAAVEAHYLIDGKGVFDLSEQQLIDCQRAQGALGCSGAQIYHGSQFILKNGIVTEDKYPYRGIQQDCVYEQGPHKIKSIKAISGRDQIEKALRKGPVLARVIMRNFQYYKQGIFSLCDPGLTDHAVVLVGYTPDYWIMRNSWGEDWGENGYMRIKKNQNKGNACGIETQAYEISVESSDTPATPATQ